MLSPGIIVIKLILINYFLLIYINFIGRSFCNNTSTIIYLSADITYLFLHTQYLEVTENNNEYRVSYTTFNRIWKKFLPHIKKLTPRSDLCLKCKDMQFNANY